MAYYYKFLKNKNHSLCIAEISSSDVPVPAKNGTLRIHEGRVLSIICRTYPRGYFNTNVRRAYSPIYHKVIEYRVGWTVTSDVKPEIDNENGIYVYANLMDCMVDAI